MNTSSRKVEKAKQDVTKGLAEVLLLTVKEIKTRLAFDYQILENIQCELKLFFVYCIPKKGIFIWW
jgi:hypothetical protein